MLRLSFFTGYGLLGVRVIGLLPLTAGSPVRVRPLGAPRGIATLGFLPPSWRVCVQLPSPAGWAGWSDEGPLEVRLAGSVISRVHGPMTAVLWDTWGVVNQAFVRVLVCDAFHSGCNRVLVRAQSADAH